MKIRKFSIIICCLVFSTILLLQGTGDASAKRAIKAPEVQMVSCLPSFFGSESIVMVSTFMISNPNKFLIEIKMDYQLNAGEQVVGKSMFPTLYIPANKTIEVKDACVVPFVLFYTEKLIAGKSKEEALNIVGTMWKGLSGRRPDAVSEDSWNKMPDQKLVMKATGSVVVITQSGQDIFQFEGEWKE